MQLTIDVDKLSLGEIEFFEEYSGQTIEALEGGGFSTRMLTALVYLQEKKTNPTYTIEDARNVELGSIDIGNPTPPADTPAGSSKSSRSSSKRSPA